MLLDRDSDTSADADALAMKYLTDEQLSELAKVRLASPMVTPQKHSRDPALDRLLRHQGKSNVSTYGMSANHMSFATKKYLERYGLLDEPASGDRNGPPSNVTSPKQSPSLQGLASGTDADTARMNVQDFLRRLSDRSGVDLECAHLPQSPDVNESHRHEHSGCSCSCSQHGAASFKPQVRGVSITSDITSQPVGFSEGHMDHNCAASDRTPVRPAGKKVSHQGAGRRESADDRTNNRVLDIERLRELPKLL